MACVQYSRWDETQRHCGWALSAVLNWTTTAERCVDRLLRSTKSAYTHKTSTCHPPKQIIIKGIRRHRCCLWLFPRPTTNRAIHFINSIIKSVPPSSLIGLLVLMGLLVLPYSYCIHRFGQGLRNWRDYLWQLTCTLFDSSALPPASCAVYIEGHCTGAPRRPENVGLSLGRSNPAGDWQLLQFFSALAQLKPEASVKTSKKINKMPQMRR